ncbi:MAG: hypothetical protein ACI9MS_002048 [Glaciecola sp.]|jgi:hypothetical protein
MITKDTSNYFYKTSIQWFLAFFLVGLFGYILPSVDYFLAVPGDLGDARFNSVILEHLYRWVTGADVKLWSPTFFFPFEGVLAFSDNHFGSSVFYILLRVIGFDREISFDGWFLIGNCLNYFAAYIVIRRLGFTGFSSAAGAFVFAFALCVLPKEGHAQLIYRFAIPFAFLAFWHLITTRRLYDLSRIFFWVAVQFFCSIYLGIFLVYLLLATLVGMVLLGMGQQLLPSLVDSIRKDHVGAKWFVSSVIILSSCAVLWLLYNYHAVSADYGFTRSGSEIKTMLPRLSSYLIADHSLLSSWVGAGITGVPMRHEHQMFFGIGVWILCLASFISIWKGQLHDKIGKVAGLSLIVLIVATLNVGGFSIYTLITYVPGLSSIRAVSRIVLVMMLPVGLLVAVGSDYLVKIGGQLVRPMKTVVSMIVLVFLGAEVVAFQSNNTPINNWVLRQEIIRSLLPEDFSEDSIIYVNKKDAEPFYLAEIDGMILAQDLGVPTLNGYSGNFPPGYLKPLPCFSYVNRLYAYANFHHKPVSTVNNISKRVTPLTMSLCDGEPVIPFKGSVNTDQVKQIKLTVTDVKMSNRQLRSTVIVSNESGQNSNTVSISGAPVRLSWRFIHISNDGVRLSNPGWDARKDLTWTIPPGKNRQVSLAVDLPVVPGSYLFEVSMVQEGVAWFHDLGMKVASATITVRRD